MGTFIQIKGAVSIPEEKTAEYYQRLYQLFCRGGMCSMQRVSLYDKGIWLISEPRFKDDGTFGFAYNYFEDTWWENATVNPDGFIYSEKIGSEDFSKVMTAAWILAEQYSTTPFFTDNDWPDDDWKSYGAWLNGLFQEQYSMQNRNIWDVYASIKTYNTYHRRKDEKIYLRDVRSYAVEQQNDEALIAIVAAESEDCDNIEDDTLWNEGRKTRYALYQCLKKIRDCAMDDAPVTAAGEAEETKLDSKEELDRRMQAIIGMMCEGEESEVASFLDSDIKGELTTLMKKSLPQVVIQYTAHLFEKDFWDLWKLVEWRKMICRPYVEKYPPIPPITTQQFLPHETRYFLYYWREDNDISLDGLEGWFAELNERYDRLMQSEKPIEGSQLVESMMTVLKKASEHFGSIIAWKDMFYEFIEHSSELRYQVWWKIFCDLVEENWDIEKANEEKLQQGKSYFQYEVDDVVRMLTKHVKETPEKEYPARMEVKGYLGLMANPALRRKVFGA